MGKRRPPRTAAATKERGRGKPLPYMFSWSRFLAPWQVRAGGANRVFPFPDMAIVPRRRIDQDAVSTTLANRFLKVFPGNPSESLHSECAPPPVARLFCHPGSR